MLFRLTLIFSLLVQPLARAAPPGPERVEVEFSIAPGEPDQTPPTAEQLRALHREAHEALDSEDPDHGFLRRWAEKFRYSKVLLNAYRWYLLKSGDLNAADHAANLAIMYLTSHGIETAGGMYLTSWAMTHELNWVAKALATTVGIGIQIPGLDPLCLALGFSYGKWPLTLNAGLQYPRIVIVKSSSFLAKTLGMQRFLPWLMTRQDAVQFMMEKVTQAEPGTYRFTTVVDGYEFELLAANGAPIVSLKMIRRREGLALRELQLSGDWDRATRKRLAYQLDPFGYNVKSAVLEIFDLYASQREEKIRDLKWVESVTDRAVLLKTPAICLGEKISPTALGKVALAGGCVALVYGYYRLNQLLH